MQYRWDAQYGVWFGEAGVFLSTWPSAGSMRDGVCTPLERLDLGTPGCVTTFKRLRTPTTLDVGTTYRSKRLTSDWAHSTLNALLDQVELEQTGVLSC